MRYVHVRARDTEKKRGFCDGGHVKNFFPVRIGMQFVTMDMRVAVCGQGIASLLGLFFHVCSCCCQHLF